VWFDWLAISRVSNCRLPHQLKTIQQQLTGINMSANNTSTRSLKRLACATAISIALLGNHAHALQCAGTPLSAAERVVALQAVNNLIGRYSHMLEMRDSYTLEGLFAMKTEGVSWRRPNGPIGIEAMKAHFKDQKANPGNSIGRMELHSMLTPIVEIAEDGKTAKGVWDSWGPGVRDGNSDNIWGWVKYGVDFVKEDGAWKIWHMQVYPVFMTAYNKSITQQAKDNAAAGQNAAAVQKLPDNWGRAANSTWIYDGKSSMIGTGPYLPEPYCTFDPKTAY
jgi:hypothetical protein